MVWGKAGSTTLATSGDDLDITSMTASKFNQFMIHKITSGDASLTQTLNNNTNSVYARRKSANGATDFTATSESNVNSSDTTTTDMFIVEYVASISGEEKLGIKNYVDYGATGAGTAPDRMEIVYKFVPSPDADITRIDFTNGNSGSYDTDSNISALGSDLTPAAAIPFPTNVQVGSRAEITDTRKIYHYTDPLVLDDDFTSYADTTAGDASWVTEDVSLLRVNPTNDNIDFKADGSVSSKDKISYDLTSISTLFLSRFSVDFTTMTASGGSGTKAFFGVTEGSVYDSTENHIGFWVREQASTANDMGIKTGVGGDWSSGGATTLFSTVPSVTKYYVELKRTSETSITLSLYSDSSYSSLVETATSTISATGSLRYFSIQTSDSSSASSAIIGSVDDVLFYNGAISTDKYWSEEGT